MEISPTFTSIIISYNRTLNYEYAGIYFVIEKNALTYGNIGWGWQNLYEYNKLLNNLLDVGGELMIYDDLYVN